MTSAFVVRCSKRPDRCRDIPPSQARTFLHRVQVRPQRFLVGARFLTGAEPDAAFPTCWLSSAPVNRILYLGRVDEVDPNEGTFTANLWEHPSGRAGVVTLPLDEHIEGELSPAVGDALQIWTWIELPGDGAIVPRYRIGVERREMTEEEREELRQYLLERDAELNGEP